MTEFNPYSSHLIYKANNPQTYLSSSSNFPGKDYQSWLSAHTGIMLSLSWRCWDSLQWMKSLDKLLIFSTTFGFLLMQVHTCSHRHTHTNTHTQTYPYYSSLTFNSYKSNYSSKSQKDTHFFSKGKYPAVIS